jgi:hypothetical protein
MQRGERRAHPKVELPSGGCGERLRPRIYTLKRALATLVHP